MKRTVRHPLGTAREDFICTPNKTKALEVLIDADFTGVFSKDSMNDPSSMCSKKLTRRQIFRLLNDLEV